MSLPPLQDAGFLQLRSEPFIFEGTTITFTEQARRGAPPLADGQALSLVPRINRKAGIGKGRQAPAIDKALPAAMHAKPDGSRSQDDFRALMDAKNKQRGEKLAAAIESRAAVETGEKRPAEDEEDHGAKRPKTNG